MSFSHLSRELRDMIYHALLHSSDGVRPHIHYECKLKGTLGETSSNSSDDCGEDQGYDGNEEKGKDDTDCLYTDPWRFRISHTSTVTPIPTAIFYVSHQVGQEAIEMFYSSNRFTFDLDADATLTFLLGLRPSSRRLIKDIGFDNRSECECECERGYSKSWHDLGDFITYHMRLHSVTIHLPPDYLYRIDKTKTAFSPAFQGSLWLTVSRLADWVMAGRIQKLRLAYDRTWKTPCMDLLNRSLMQLRTWHLVLLETLQAENALYFQSSKMEWLIQQEDTLGFRKSSQRQPYKDVSDSFDALQAGQEKTVPRIGIDITREDDPPGDIETVLVLTRPTDWEVRGRAGQYHQDENWPPCISRPSRFNRSQPN